MVDEPKPNGRIVDTIEVPSTLTLANVAKLREEMNALISKYSGVFHRLYYDSTHPNEMVSLIRFGREVTENNI